MSLIRAYIGRRLLSGWHKWRVAGQAAGDPDEVVLARLLNGKSMLVPRRDFVGKRLLWEGAYEYETVHLIERLSDRLGRRDILLDVGANLGSHTLFYADVFRRVHAFEPYPPTAALLRRNVEINDETGVHVYAIGLSSVDGELDFVGELGAAGNLGSSAFLTSASSGAARALRLPVRRGDCILEEEGVGRVDVIKIDVEGHEIDVLAGLQRTIKRDRPVVVFEFQPHFLQAQGGFEAVKRLLGGYDLYVPSRASRMRGQFDQRALIVRHEVAIPLVQHLKRTHDLAPTRQERHAQ